MTINQNKSLKITLVILLLFLLTIQGAKSRVIIKEKELLQTKITVQQQNNRQLAESYNGSSNLSSISQPSDLKDKTAEILSELESFKLELIDFSSSKAELNLNLKGDFRAILNFIYYLETEMKALQIDEFKIKENRDKLFFFVKLKNELI